MRPAACGLLPHRHRRECELLIQWEEWSLHPLEVVLLQVVAAHAGAVEQHDSLFDPDEAGAELDGRFDDYDLRLGRFQPNCPGV